MQNDSGWLAAQFDSQRPRLRALAQRMLSSPSDADDAVQEAWLRIERAGGATVENLSGWLTTVVARICLDMLRARRARAEAPEEATLATVPEEEAEGPERQTLLADSISLALLVVLETLSPNERLAFVLHDLFDRPFHEIAALLGCSLVAARQLASRARRRVQGAPTGPDVEAALARQRAVVEQFLIAARTGDLGGLLAVLDPNVVLHCDDDAVTESAARKAQGAPPLAPEVRGANEVAKAFVGRAAEARVALIDGAIGAVWAPGGKPRAIFEMSIVAGKIVAIALAASPARVRALAPVLFEEGAGR